MKENGSGPHIGDPHIWMIRTSDNVLSGPYTQEQLIQLVEEEKLELTDEICRGNSYWIYLHEEQEVKKHLGIEVPAALVEPEEPTQTETDSIIARRTEPSHHQVSTPASSQASSQSSSQASSSMMSQRSQRSTTASIEAKVEAKEEAPKPEYTPVVEPEDSADDVPELAVSADSIEDHTAVLNNRAFREFRPRDAATTPTTNTTPAAVPAPTPTSTPAPAAAVSGAPLTDTIPQSMISATSVSPSAAPEINGVTIIPGSTAVPFDEEVDARKRFWTLTGVVLGVGAIVIYFAWKHLHS